MQRKWVKVELKPKIVNRETTKFVRFLAKFAGFQPSKNEDRIPYKVVRYGLDWVLVMKNGRPIYVPEEITAPCEAAAPKRVVEEVWEGN